MVIPLYENEIHIIYVWNSNVCFSTWCYICLKFKYIFFEIHIIYVWNSNICFSTICEILIWRFFTHTCYICMIIPTIYIWINIICEILIWRMLYRYDNQVAEKSKLHNICLKNWLICVAIYMLFVTRPKKIIIMNAQINQIHIIYVWILGYMYILSFYDICAC